MKPKIGIFLSILGAILLLGFNWAGSLTIVIGAILVVVGLVLALRGNHKEMDGKWVHNTTHTDDD